MFNSSQNCIVTKLACSECKHWRRLNAASEIQTTVGMCRKNPPVPIHDGTKLASVFPVTGESEHCGQFNQ
jgi:hypothetical protein